ncbi:MAG: hypothetical protein ACTH0B_01905 [Senegalia sp. (in: firmicutes)]
MNKDIIKNIIMEYEKRKDRAVHEQRVRKQEVYTKIPQIRDIDNEIKQVSIDLSKYIIENPLNYDTMIEKLKQRIERLKREKAILLTENNISFEYLDVNYKCNKCKDSGYLSTGEKCSCFKQSLINKAYDMSNLDKVLQKENFSNFDINIFSEEKIED